VAATSRVVALVTRHSSLDAHMMTFARLGAVFAGLAVMLGAFGAHLLQSRLSIDDRAIFETGVRYQMYHALALFAVAFAWRVGAPPAYATVAGWAFVAGIVVFSGSLYALVLTGVRSWGAVTPIGGLAFLVGWIALALAFVGRTEGQ
jgi:uncharacterized membrane protein YgdD (TMEM256/DUF423 family)